MPVYRVWYRNNEEPLEFAAPGRYSDTQIVRHVLQHEGIAQDDTAAALASAQALIAAHGLAPVRYTEDESEMNTIG